VAKAKSVDEYISEAPKAMRPKLEAVRRAIRAAAPFAKESISYRMPYYSYRGRLAWFGLHKGHIGLYVRPPVVEDHKKELVGYVTTKSSVHFPTDRKVPVSLIRRLVKVRVEINKAESKDRG
jgi:uncharacterized protein YdhG (YjbR/CyaY superfamily)